MSDTNKRKLFHMFLPLCMAVLVIAADIVFLVMPDRTASETENRNLQQFPKLTWTSVTQGRFETQFDTYIADQFPFRDGWIRLETGITRLAGVTQSQGIFLANDGYLIRGYRNRSEEELTEALADMTSLAAGRENVRRYAMIVPSAVSIMRDKLPWNAAGQIAGDDTAVIDWLYPRLLDEGFYTVDVRDALHRLYASGTQVYYRTDHHWTTDAAYEAYHAFAAAAGIRTAGNQTPGTEYERSAVTDRFQGTLTASSGFRSAQTDTIHVYLPVQETPYMVTNMDTGEKRSSLYDTSYLDTRDQYGLFLGGNHGEIKIQTAAESGRKLLVIKDSYANCMIPFLLPDFGTIIVIDPRYYLGDTQQLVEEEGITDILFLYNTESI